ncbi:hypothetical protein VXS06_14380 [Photobacterium toruni]|uniref:Uncharacterized protein n=1 Tax=Photobacterium toruni TaxID=1935446 RepID=A0ABU6L8S0_9GAMM|nr:hypothetical protein [Photobacterium toruni]
MKNETKIDNLINDLDVTTRAVRAVLMSGDKVEIVEGLGEVPTLQSRTDKAVASCIKDIVDASLDDAIQAQLATSLKEKLQEAVDKSSKEVIIEYAGDEIIKQVNEAVNANALTEIKRRVNGLNLNDFLLENNIIDMELGEIAACRSGTDMLATQSVILSFNQLGFNK